MSVFALSGLLFLVFFGIGAFGWLDWRARSSFLRDATHVAGSVLDVSCGKRPGHCTWRVAYLVDGQRHLLSSITPPAGPGREGGQVEVAYLVRRPGGEVDARFVESALRGQNVIPMLMGVLGSAFAGVAMVLAGAAMAVPARRRKKPARAAGVAQSSDRHADG